MDKFVSIKGFNEFESFKTTVLKSEDRYTEVRCSYEEPCLSSGETLLIQMPHLVLNYSVNRIENPLQLSIAATGEQMESLFLLEGTVQSRFDLIPKQVIAGKNQHAFHYSPEMSARHILQKGFMQAIHINFDLSFFKSLMQSATQKQTDLICDNLERKKVFFASPGLQPEMKDILYAIMNCKFQGATRLLYLEAKTLELFSLQMLQLNSATEPSLNTITMADKEKLKAVYAYIEENYLLPLSLESLSLNFMLNEFKLKKGYKTLFNTTVFNHIYHLRMAKAKRLLTEENMNVSMVSDLIGYHNIAAFSTAFKKRFGYSPSKFSNVKCHKRSSE